jgi:hypothetical protein
MAHARDSALRASRPQISAAPVAATAAYAIAPRLDLRTGAVAAGAATIDAPGLTPRWIAALGDARTAWRAAGYGAPLSCLAPASAVSDVQGAGDLDAALRAAGFEMRTLTLEVEETALLADRAASIAALERLRARGWGVLLRSAPECPLPLGARARSLFTEILVAAPADITPYLGLEGFDEAPLARRVRAAANAGLNVTASGLNSLAQAGLLIAGGFDRGEGPGLRVRAFA